MPNFEHQGYNLFLHGCQNEHIKDNEDADSATRTAADSMEVDVSNVRPAELKIAATSAILTLWQQVSCTRL